MSTISVQPSNSAKLAAKDAVVPRITAQRATGAPTAPSSHSASYFSSTDRLDGGRPEPGRHQTTALAKHVGFFDVNGDGRVTFSESKARFAELGITGLKGFAFALMSNLVIASMVKRRPAITIDLKNIHRSKHASDSDIYDDQGKFNQAKFDALFADFDHDGDGALDGPEIQSFLKRNREDVIGAFFAKAELPFLLELAGETKRVGGEDKQVLTRERLAKFYDGSLFYEMAGRPVPNWNQ